MEIDGSRLLYLESCAGLVNSLKQDNQKLKQSKSEAFKWAYSLEKENAQLKQDYKQKIEDMKSLSDEYDNLYKELYNSSNKIIELQTQLYDAQVIKNRLTKILNETSDYTL